VGNIEKTRKPPRFTPYYKKKAATLKTQVVRIYSSDLETLPNIEKVLGSTPIFNKETG
jgi:uncharacterized membrane protein